MARELFSKDGIYITAYAGPKRDDGGPRTRVQITNRNGGAVEFDVLSLSLEEWATLVDGIRAVIRGGFTTSAQP